MHSIRVFCQFDFEAMHCWPEAPNQVKFLRDPHRHIFHVRCEWEVLTMDRSKEFILLKRQAKALVGEMLMDPKSEHETWSCEQWAAEIGKRLHCAKVEVSEDGENGAVVEI